jgi:heme-degrading monooxygenase HmoA
MSQEIVELVLFRLAEGVTEADFLAAAQETDRWLQRQAGYLRRELSRDEAGQWADIVHWESLALAEAAAAGFMEEPAGQQMAALLAGDSVQIFHTEVVHRA